MYVSVITGTHSKKQFEMFHSVFFIAYRINGYNSIVTINGQSSHYINKTNLNASYKVTSRTKYLHAGSFTAPITNDKIAWILENCDLARIPKFPFFFAGYSKTIYVLSFFIKNLEWGKILKLR